MKGLLKQLRCRHLSGAVPQSFPHTSVHSFEMHGGCKGPSFVCGPQASASCQFPPLHLSFESCGQKQSKIALFCPCGVTISKRAQLSSCTAWPGLPKFPCSVLFSPLEQHVELQPLLLCLLSCPRRIPDSTPLQTPLPLLGGPCLSTRAFLSASPLP